MKKFFNVIFKSGAKNKKPLVQSQAQILNNPKPQIKEVKLENPKPNLETPQSQNTNTQPNIFQDW